MPGSRAHAWPDAACGGGRGEVNQVLEAARRAGLLGSGLEARVLLHVERADLAAGLQRLQQARCCSHPRAHPFALQKGDEPGAQAGNGADPLRYVFIVSQVELVASAGAAGEADHSASAEAEGLGRVTVGVARARGSKCQRCGACELACALLSMPLPSRDFSCS